MQAWYLCEIPHPFVPQEALDRVAPMRGSAEEIWRPAGRARLYEECVDEYHLRHEAGLNILSNGDYAGIGCFYGASPVILGILAQGRRFAQLILIDRSSFMTHEEAEKGIRMFAKEVLPGLKALKRTPVA